MSKSGLEIEKHPRFDPNDYSPSARRVFGPPRDRNYNDVTIHPEEPLALAMQTESTEVETVLSACARVYTARRMNVETLDTIELREGRGLGGRLHGIVVHEENRIECVIPRDDDVSLYIATLDRLARAGWDLWVLIPTVMVGSAHRHLRGVAVTLQPWWETGTGVCFGRPEIP